MREWTCAGPSESMKKLTKSGVEFSKRVVVVNCVVPLAMLAWDTYRGALGANPLEFITHVTGMLALVFITLSLAVTPLRRVTGMQWLAVHRRTLGLFGFSYAVLHLFAYVWFDKNFGLAAIVDDVWKRPFIAVGMTTIALMLPLAITSTNAMIKRVGGKRWRTLHRLAYAIGVGGVVHYYMLVKADTRLPIAFGVVVGVLLLFRFADAYVVPRLATQPPPRVTPE